MSKTTLWNILNNSDAQLDMRRGVIIPMIQRDYAQGRRTNKADVIRKVFLGKIIENINRVLNQGTEPMQLDFIYGFIQSGAFTPLDGQQRLTTLYLIHWYFAFKEKKLEEYTSQFAKFSYQTRSSSDLFFKKINNDLNETDRQAIFDNGKTFESIISNKNWFFVKWKYDLTVSSAITMLDEIHNTFETSTIRFDDLISEAKPPVVFNFLDIKSMGLTDDLYIKMNARGKPLTGFENLKAELTRLIEASNFNNGYNYKIKHSTGSKSVDVVTYFATKIDTSWSDYFWTIRNKKTNDFDDKLLNLLAFIALNEKAKLDLSQFENCLAELNKSKDFLTYYKFKTLDLIDENTIITYIDVLDQLTTDDEKIKKHLANHYYIAKGTILSSSFQNDFNSRYEQRVLFYALFKFLIRWGGTASSFELERWDRLVRNLVQNTYYNSPRIYQDSILSLDNIIDNYNGDIYKSFLQLEPKGFDSQQVREELLKIILIEKSDNWRDLILSAESHSYLSGQIIFLLSFSGIYDRYLQKKISWTNDEDTAYRNVFSSYYKKFEETFTGTGLRKFDNEEFRRALLTKGDYTLFATNWSFLVDNHRDVSWKRLLREAGNRTQDSFIKKVKYLQEVYDDLEDSNTNDGLKQIIKQHECKDWKKDFIEHAFLMKKSYQYFFKRFDNGNIYILRKSKYFKYEDPEVKSLLIKQALTKKGFNDNDIELGYIEKLSQYGIVRIKNYKPRVAYNYDGQRNYIIRQKGKEDFITEKLSEIIKYITENF